MKLMKKAEFERMYPEHRYTLHSLISNEMLPTLKLNGSVLLDEKEALEMCERTGRHSERQDIVTVKELSRRFGVGYHTMLRLAGSGVIKPVNDKGRALYSVPDVERKLKEMQRRGAKHGRDSKRK